LIIECCKINQNSKYIEENIIKIKDWNQFINLAYAHGVFQLVYHGIKKNHSLIPKNILKKFQYYNMQIVKQNMLMTAELIKIIKLLEVNGINVIPFKGPVLSQLAYGDVTLRQYVDLDILVKKNELNTIINILKNNAYSKLYTEADFKHVFFDLSHDLSLLSHNNIKFEFHWRLLNDNYLTNLNSIDILQNPIRVKLHNYTITTFSNEIYLIYLSVHGSKHNWERIEWLLDIVYLIKSNSLDWEACYRLIKISNCENIVLTTLKLSHDLFELNLNDDLLKKINEKKISQYSRRLKKEIFNNFFNVTLANEKKATLLQLELIEGFKNKFLFIFSRFEPNKSEFNLIKLPKYLGFIYYIIRLVNILRNILKR